MDYITAAKVGATLVLGAILLTGPATANNDAIVFIKVTTTDGKLRDRGSGILLNKEGYILTARHVIALKTEFDAIRVSLKSANRPDIPVSGPPICPEEAKDLCLLKIRGNDVGAENIAEFYKLRCRPLRTEETVIGAGYALADPEVSRTPGPITSGIDDNWFYPTAIGLLPGMSGGPVFDTNGDVVGVVAGGGHFPLTADKMALATVRTFVNPLSNAANLLNLAQTPCAGPALSSDTLSAAFNETKQGTVQPDSAVDRASKFTEQYYELAARVRLLEEESKTNMVRNIAVANRTLASGDLEVAEQEIAAIEQEAKFERTAVRHQIAILLTALEKAGFAAGGVLDRSRLWKDEEKRIKICFLNGELEKHKAIVLVARRWMLFANIEFDFGNSSRPRICDDELTFVRIDIEADNYWSYLGRDALRVRNGPTMGLGLRGKSNIYEADAVAFILHEFGHLLGLEHIYNHKDECDFDWERLYNEFDYHKDLVDRTFRQVKDSISIGDLDPTSIMSWHLPPYVYARGEASPCYRPDPPRDLALSDKLVAFRSYP